MKKFRSLALVTVLVFCLVALSPLKAVVFAEEPPIRVVVDDMELSFDAPPRIINGRMLVPVRGIFEAMGATVLWNGDYQTIIALRLDTVIRIAIGSVDAIVDKEIKELDVPAEIFEDRTFVPLRFISEGLGALVEWDGDTRTAYITTDKAHWSDPGDNLTYDLIFNSEWVELDTGDVMVFDPEMFIQIATDWPDGSPDSVYYTFSETNEAEANLIGIFVGEAYLNNHWFEYDPDSGVLTEYMFGDAISNWIAY